MIVGIWKCRGDILIYIAKERKQLLTTFFEYFAVFMTLWDWVYKNKSI